MRDKCSLILIPILFFGILLTTPVLRNLHYTGSEIVILELKEGELYPFYSDGCTLAMFNGETMKINDYNQEKIVLFTITSNSLRFRNLNGLIFGLASLKNYLVNRKYNPRIYSLDYKNDCGISELIQNKTYICENPYTEYTLSPVTESHITVYGNYMEI